VQSPVEDQLQLHRFLLEGRESSPVCEDLNVMTVRGMFNYVVMMSALCIRSSGLIAYVLIYGMVMGTGHYHMC
jgi:hypothetical protein